MTISVDLVQQQLLREFSSVTRVQSRRPGKTIQVQLPAYLSDGDAATIFVEDAGDGLLLVSDLAHTVMRLSYVNSSIDSALPALEHIAGQHGFHWEDGALVARVDQGELIGAIFGLAQIESAAEHIVQPKVRGSKTEDFRKIVRGFIAEMFLERAILEVDLDPATPGLFTVDALISAGQRKVAVAAVPGDIEAERAIGTRYRDPKFADRWIAIPRDVNSLSPKSRARLMNAFVVPVAEYSESRVRDQLADLTTAA